MYFISYFFCYVVYFQSGSNYIFLLATTNRIDAVDMTLRRPGRIDREIEVPVPSCEQRKQVGSRLYSYSMRFERDEGGSCQSLHLGLCFIFCIFTAIYAILTQSIETATGCSW